MHFQVCWIYEAIFPSNISDIIQTGNWGLTRWPELYNALTTHTWWVLRRDANEFANTYGSGYTGYRPVDRICKFICVSTQHSSCMICFDIVYVWSSGESSIPSLNYVANITREYSFINPTDLEMHQVLFKELLTQNTFKRFVITIKIYFASFCVEFVTMFKL